MHKYLLRIIAANEQDQAECREWLSEASAAEIKAVWVRCQKEHADPIDEVVSRLAQLKLAELIEEQGRKK